MPDGADHDRTAPSSIFILKKQNETPCNNLSRSPVCSAAPLRQFLSAAPPPLHRSGRVPHGDHRSAAFPLGIPPSKGAVLRAEEDSTSESWRQLYSRAALCRFLPGAPHDSDQYLCRPCQSGDNFCCARHHADFPPKAQPACAFCSHRLAPRLRFFYILGRTSVPGTPVRHHFARRRALCVQHYVLQPAYYEQGGNKP